MAENFSIADDIESLFREKMKSFADWATTNWTMTEKEAETLTDPTDSPKEYTRGYNAGVGSIRDALDCWLEEWGI
jgi:hypothetical protein